MLDDYLIKSALPRLTVNKLIKLCLLAAKYDIKFLRMQYICELIGRINVDSVVQVNPGLM